MTLFTLANVKTGLGETGTSNDSKVNIIYGPQADNFIISQTIAVKGMPNPPAATVGVLSAQELLDLKTHADLLAISYFWKGESGDTLTAEQAEKNFISYFTNKWKRPRFKTSIPI